MNMVIPKDWVSITGPELDEILSVMNYHRDGWSDGVMFELHGTNKQFACLKDNGEAFIDPLLVTLGRSE